jgi:hypothetical protein
MIQSKNLRYITFLEKHLYLKNDYPVQNLQDLLDDLSGDKNKIRVGQANRQLGEALLITTSYKDAVRYFQKYLGELKDLR